MGPGINTPKARSVIGLVVMLWPVDSLGGQLAGRNTYTWRLHVTWVFFFLIFIVIQLQLYAFLPIPPPHPS